MIHIYNNPKGEAYRRLLDYAAQHSPSFVLAKRHQLGQHESCTEVFEKLRPFLVKKVRTSESLRRRSSLSIAYSPNDWLYFYECREDAIDILKSAADSLLDWQHPHLPEDLCFLDDEEEDWLINIAHEGILRLHITEEEAEKLSSEIQGLFLTGQFNRDLSRLLADAVRHQAEHLEISGYGIRTLPEALFQAHDLRSLTLFEPHIDRLPERLFDLVGLEKLIIWTTNLYNLPSAIRQLQQLKHLTIYCGCYQGTPPDGIVLKKEEVFFNQLPPEIGELQNLVSLDIQYTALRGLPASMKRLSNLKRLTLINHLMEARPSVLDEMPHVKHIHYNANSYFA